jgi:F-type H+-transporting ATPase subunit delta
VVSDLVAERWSGSADLREAVEQLAATAALTAAETEGSLDDVEDELFRFARLLEREPALRAGADRPRACRTTASSRCCASLLGGKAPDATSGWSRSR